jgi:hypothetical protein
MQSFSLRDSQVALNFLFKTGCLHVAVFRLYAGWASLSSPSRANALRLQEGGGVEYRLLCFETVGADHNLLITNLNNEVV